ncbi:MAG: hypothetical protein HQL44_04765 [Alphaproteobacteria bacterium]|nr:hypothetical protein [Alphaproteobacteria bacterium]
MASERQGHRFFVPAIVVGLIVLAAHSCWILSDARFLDGTYFEYFIEQDNWGVLTWNMYGVLMHPWAWLMWPFMGTDNPGLAFRIVEWACIAIIAMAVQRIAAKHARLDVAESMFLALAVALFPSYSAAMMSSTVIYIFPTALFYVGWAIYFDAALSAKECLWLRLLPVPIWLLAFFHNSLLSFHVGFTVLLLALSIAHRSAPFESAGGVIRFLLSFLRKNALVAALPFLFFALRALSFPADSPFGTHNNLVFDPARNVRAFLGGFHHHVSMNLSSAFLGQEWLLGLVLAILGGWLALRWRKNGQALSTFWIAALGVMFAVLAILPYAAVAKAAPLQSFGARYGILSGLGGGLILLAVWRSLPLAKRWRTLFGAFLLAGLALRGISDDLMWLGRWAKDRAAIAALAQHPPPQHGTILLWQDDWRIGNESYRPFELAWFFNKAWGGEFWGGIDLLERGPDSLVYDGNAFFKIKDKHLLRDFESNGCLRNATVLPTLPTPDAKHLGMSYLGYHLFDNKGLDGFLSRLLKVNLGPEDCQTLPELLKQDIPYPKSN